MQRWPRLTAAASLAVASCTGSTSPSDTAQLASVSQEATAALTQPVVSDLFRMAAYVAGGLAGGPRGCVWRFDVSQGGYAPLACGQPSDLVETYAISLPDLPHRGVALPIDVPLMVSGALRFPVSGCARGFELRDLQRPVLAVCSEGNLADGEPWHSTLRDGREAGWTIVAERAGVDHPSPRTRYTIELQAPAGGQVTLQHDVLIGVERSETTMLVTYGAATLRFTGFAGATGPDYTVTQNGGPLGRIAWAGRVGFVTADPAGGSLPEPDDRLLRDGRLLLTALARMTGGTALLLERLDE
jgi:hypothetical protein